MGELEKCMARLLFGVPSSATRNTQCRVHCPAQVLLAWKVLWFMFAMMFRVISVPPWEEVDGQTTTALFWTYTALLSA